MTHFLLYQLIFFIINIFIIAAYLAASIILIIIGIYIYKTRNRILISRTRGTVIMVYKRFYESWKSYYIGKGNFVYVQETSGRNTDTSNCMRETVCTLCLPVRLLKNKEERDNLLKILRELPFTQDIVNIKDLKFYGFPDCMEAVFSSISNNSYVQFCIEPVGEGEKIHKWPNPNITIPGNGPNPNETLQQSAFREFYEETHCIPKYVMDPPIEMHSTAMYNTKDGKVLVNNKIHVLYVCHVKRFSNQKADIKRVLFNLEKHNASS